MLEQGKNQGLAGDKVDALNKHLALIIEAPKSTLPEQKKSLKLSEKRKKLVERKKPEEGKKTKLKKISVCLRQKLIIFHSIIKTEH